jgi:tripartite-type tricarboxylate transporter receptor subunit TctC
MYAKIFWSTKGERTTQERRTIGHAQAAQIGLMTAGVIMSAVLLIGVIITPLCAQSYPNRPIRLILPMPPGGPVDILGRIIGQKLAERLGQPVVPENRPGAGGNIGMEYTAKSRPDGYTVVLTTTGLSISPSLYKKLNYDPIKDLVPISLTAQSHFVVLVQPSLPVKNLKEFVDYAKANPGKLNFGSSGIGMASQLANVLLNSLAKIDIVHVPYKGAAPALTGLMGGEVAMMVIVTAPAIPQIQTGKVRALAVLGNERVPSLPNVPTAKEAGIDNLVVTGWYGLLAPAGTPRDIVNRLSEEWTKIAAMPDVKEKMQSVEFEPISSTPEQFSEFLKSETVRWGKVIKEANISRID